jgi:hypothetical protein
MIGHFIYIFAHRPRTQKPQQAWEDQGNIQPMQPTHTLLPVLAESGARLIDAAMSPKKETRLQRSTTPALHHFGVCR